MSTTDKVKPGQKIVFVTDRLGEIAEGSLGLTNRGGMTYVKFGVMCADNRWVAAENCHRTRPEAIARANQMRDEKAAWHEAEAARLRALSFD